MSVDDIDSISTMMLGELRDVHNLEKEMLTCREAVVIQERRFEQEVENFCMLEQRKESLAATFKDLVQNAQVEHDRSTQSFLERSNAVTLIDIAERLQSYLDIKNECISDLGPLLQTSDSLDNKLTAMKITVDVNILLDIDEYKVKVLAKEEFLRQNQDVHFGLTFDADAAASILENLSRAEQIIRKDCRCLQHNMENIESSLTEKSSLRTESAAGLVQLRTGNEAVLLSSQMRTSSLIGRLASVHETYDLLNQDKSNFVIERDAIISERAVLTRRNDYVAAELNQALKESKRIAEQADEVDFSLRCLKTDICSLHSQTEALNLRANNFAVTDSSDFDLSHLQQQLESLSSVVSSLSKELDKIAYELSEECDADTILGSRRITFNQINSAISHMERRVIDIQGGTQTIRLHIDNILCPALENALAELQSTYRAGTSLRALKYEIQFSAETAEETLSSLKFEQEQRQQFLCEKQKIIDNLQKLKDCYADSILTVEIAKREVMEADIQHEMARQAASDEWVSAQISTRINQYEADLVRCQNEKVYSLKKELDIADKMFKADFKKIEKTYNTKKRFLGRRIDELKSG